MDRLWVRYGEWGVLLLMVTSILWKGGKGLEAVWLMALLVFILTALFWKMQKKERSTNAVDVPIGLWVSGLLYLLWTLLSYATSHTRNYGLDEVLRSTASILLFFWILRMRTRRRLTLVPSLFPPILSGVIVLASCIGIAVYILQPVDRFVGTFFDVRFHTDFWPNAWAEMVLLAWPIILFTALRNVQNKLRTALWIGAFSLTLTALALSYSRGAIIAFVGQVSLMSIAYGILLVATPALRAGILTQWRKIAVGTILIVLVTATLFFSINALRSLRFDVQSVGAKATFTAAEGLSSVNERAQFWQQAFQLAKEQPILGWGPYSFRFVQTAQMQGVLATADHPHNMFLKLAAERGIPAVIFFLLFCLFAFLHIGKSINAYSIALFTGIAGVAAHNLIDFNLQFTGIGITAVLAAALLMPSPTEHEPSIVILTWRTRLRSMLRWVEISMLLILTALLLYEGALLGLSSLGRHAEARGDTSAALHWYHVSEPALFSRDLFLSSARLAMQTRAFGQAEKALKKYQMLNAEDVRAWKMRGELELRKGQAQAAAATLRIAFEKGKYTDISITRLQLLALQQLGDQNELKEQEVMTIDVFLRFAEAIEQNTHYIALSQNPEELLSLARLMHDVYPESDQNFIAIAQSVFDHAEEERSTYAGRPSGILW